MVIPVRNIFNGSFIYIQNISRWKRPAAIIESNCQTTPGLKASHELGFAAMASPLRSQIPLRPAPTAVNTGQEAAERGVLGLYRALGQRESITQTFWLLKIEGSTNAGRRRGKTIAGGNESARRGRKKHLTGK